MDKGKLNLKRIKNSGNFKRKVKKAYEKMIEANITENKADEKDSASRAPSTAVDEELDLINEFDLPSTSSSSNHLEMDETLAQTSSENQFVSSDDDEEQELISELEKNIEVRKQMQSWATSFKINHSALKALFNIWNTRIPNILPKDPRTLLKTPKQISLTSMQNGQYWHNGLFDHLKSILENFSMEKLETISLNFNIDGLPIHKSSRCEFWPILCNIHDTVKCKLVLVKDDVEYFFIPLLHTYNKHI